MQTKEVVAKRNLFQEAQDFPIEGEDNRQQDPLFGRHLPKVVDSNQREGTLRGNVLLVGGRQLGQGLDGVLGLGCGAEPGCMEGKQPVVSLYQNNDHLQGLEDQAYTNLQISGFRHVINTKHKEVPRPG